MIIFFCNHAFHEACLLASETLPNPPESSGSSLVGSKVRHTIVLRALNKPPSCPICNDAEHTHEKQKQKENKGVIRPSTRGFIRGRSHSGSRDDDGMPPMVPLRL